MYVTTPYSTVMAVDARNGKRSGAKSPSSRRRSLLRPNNRGVAISNGTVYFGTLDARLIALDAPDRQSE